MASSPLPQPAPWIVQLHLRHLLGQVQAVGHQLLRWQHAIHQAPSHGLLGADETTCRRKVLAKRPVFVAKKTPRSAGLYAFWHRHLTSEGPPKKTTRFLPGAPANPSYPQPTPAIPAIPACLRSAVPWLCWGPGSSPTSDSSPMRGQYLGWAYHQWLNSRGFNGDQWWWMAISGD